LGTCATQLESEPDDLCFEVVYLKVELSKDRSLPCAEYGCAGIPDEFLASERKAL